MTSEQRERISYILGHYVSWTSQCILYEGWSDAVKSATLWNAYEDLVKDLKDLDLDFEFLSYKDAMLLGCRQNPIDAEYYDIPVYLYDVIPDGVKVYVVSWSSDGIKEIVRQGQNLSNDNRAGFLGYCFKIKLTDKYGHYI